MSVTLLTVLISSAIAWYFISGKSDFFEQSTAANIEYSGKKTKCWSGFSSSLGNFTQEDKSDPCHYGKLFHQAMSQLKVKNDEQSQAISTGEFNASQDYILFLSEQLDQRRLDEKISLNLALGKSELRRLNYIAAQHYFELAENIVSSSANPDAKILAEISRLNSQIKAALK